MTAMKNKRAARAWAHDTKKLHTMLRCQNVWISREDPEFFVLCARLPGHDGPCRRITGSGAVRTIDDWWVRA